MTKSGERLSGRPNIGGFRHLSRRQDEVARAVARGLTNGEICGELKLQPGNLQQVLNAIRIKAGLPHRQQLPLRRWCLAYVEKNPDVPQ